MAIFKYKKPNGSGGYSIEEMPVISNTYTEYIVTEDISEDPQIVLKPSQTSFNINEQKTFNKVTASIDLLSTTPTYTYNINDRNKTITFNSTEWKTTMGYGDKFPPGIKISIPSSVWLNKNTEASNPPATLTISNKTDTIPVPAGYYSSNFEIKLSDTAKGQIVSNNILYNTTIMGVTGTNTNNRNTALTIVSSPTSSNKSGAAAAQILENYQAWVNGSLISGSIVKRGNIKDQTQIKPSNYSSAYYNTGYYTGGSTNGKVNIATGAITLTANSPNGTPYTYSDWGNVFPTSITVAVPSDLPAVSSPPSTTTITTQNGSIQIDAGYYTSDITITATLPTSTIPSDTTISTPSETVIIPAGYLSSDVTVTSDITNNGAPGTQLLMPRAKASYPIYEGYYSSDFTVSPSIQFLTVTNPSLTYNSSTGYYEKSYEPTSSASSSTVWGDKYLVGFTLQLSGSTSSKIVSGQSVCGISGTHVCSSSSNIGKNFFWLNADSSTTANTLAPAIYKWKDNIFNSPYTGSSQSIEHDHVNSNGTKRFSVNGITVLIPSTIKDKTTDGVKTQNYVTFSSYADYMSYIGFDSTYQDCVPSYGLSFISDGTSGTLTSSNLSHISVVFVNGLNRIKKYAFAGSNCEYCSIQANSNQTGVIEPYAFANSYFRQLTLRLQKNSTMTLGHSAFDNKNSDYSGRVSCLVIELSTGSYLTIESTAFYENPIVGNSMHIYGSTSCLNLQDAPWGQSNLSYTIH